MSCVEIVLEAYRTCFRRLSRHLGLKNIGQDKASYNTLVKGRRIKRKIKVNFVGKHKDLRIKEDIGRQYYA